MIKIKIKPLSVNDAWKGRRFKTSKYRRYRIDCLSLLPQKKIGPPPYIIDLEFGLSSMGGDFDNPIKPFIDIISEKYGFNDNQIMKGIIEKVKVKKGKEYVKFNLSPYKTSNWISVKDGLPKKDGDYMVGNPEYQSGQCYFSEGEWRPRDLYSYSIDFITHWQPILKPPKQ